jgi:outer membrane lipoprotein SlyB
MKKMVKLTITAWLLVGCADRFGGDIYSGSAVGEVSTSLSGVIIEKRPIIISDATPGMNGGAVVGGVAGGLIGSTIGQGRGSIVASVLGALVGGAAGQAAGNSIQSEPGFEYQVQLTSGSTISITQGTHPHLAIGQNVFVIESENGRSRIIPNNMRAAMPQPKSITTTETVVTTSPAIIQAGYPVPQYYNAPIIQPFPIVETGVFIEPHHHRRW